MSSLIGRITVSATTFLIHAQRLDVKIQIADPEVHEDPKEFFELHTNLGVIRVNFDQELLHGQFRAEVTTVSSLGARTMVDVLSTLFP